MSTNTKEDMDDAPVNFALHRAGDRNTLQEAVEQIADESVERFSRIRALDALHPLDTHPYQEELRDFFSLKAYLSKQHKCAADDKGVVRTITPTRIPLQMAYIPANTRVHVAGDVYIEPSEYPRYFIKNMMPGASLLPAVEDPDDRDENDDDRSMVMLSFIAPKPEFIPVALHVGFKISDPTLRQQLSQITDKQPRTIRPDFLALDEVTASLLDTTRWELVVGYHPKFSEMFPGDKAFIYKDSARVQPLIYGVVCKDLEVCSTDKLTIKEMTDIHDKRIRYLVLAESHRRNIESMLKVVSESFLREEAAKTRDDGDGDDNGEKAPEKDDAKAVAAARRTLFTTMRWNNFSEAVDNLCEQFADKPELLDEHFTESVQRSYEMREADRQLTPSDIRAELKRVDSDINTMQKELDKDGEAEEEEESGKSKKKKEEEEKETNNVLTQEQAEEKLNSMLDETEQRAQAAFNEANRVTRELQHLSIEKKTTPVDPSTDTPTTAAVASATRYAPTTRPIEAKPVDPNATELGDVDF